jgi:hypothetical protein
MDDGGVPSAWGGRRSGVWQRRKKVKGEKERRREKRAAAAVYLPSLLSACDLALDKVFLKFKNKLCRVPDCGHSAKMSLPSASCTGTRQRSVLESLPSANGPSASWTGARQSIFYFWQPNFLWYVPILCRPTSTILVQL